MPTTSIISTTCQRQRNQSADLGDTLTGGCGAQADHGNAHGTQVPGAVQHDSQQSQPTGPDPTALDEPLLPRQAGQARRQDVHPGRAEANEHERPPSASLPKREPRRWRPTRKVQSPRPLPHRKGSHAARRAAVRRRQSTARPAISLLPRSTAPERRLRQAPPATPRASEGGAPERLGQVFRPVGSPSIPEGVAQCQVGRSPGRRPRPPPQAAGGSPPQRKRCRQPPDHPTPGCRSSNALGPRCHAARRPGSKPEPGKRPKQPPGRVRSPPARPGLLLMLPARRPKRPPARAETNPNAAARMSLPAHRAAPASRPTPASARARRRSSRPSAPAPRRPRVQRGLPPDRASTTSPAPLLWPGCPGLPPSHR